MAAVLTLLFARETPAAPAKPPRAAGAPALVLSASASATGATDGPGSAPLLFVENVGQFDERARFRVHGGAASLALAEDALWFTATASPARLATPGPARLTGRGRHAGLPGNARGAGDLPYAATQEELPDTLRDEMGVGVHVKLSFVGANPHSRPVPFDPQPTHVSFFRGQEGGQESGQRHAGVPVWGGVRYPELYPGVDLEVTGAQGRLVSRLVARPGAHLDAVRLRLEGADAVALDAGPAPVRPEGTPAATGGSAAGARDVREGRLRLSTIAGAFSLPLLLVSDVSPAAAPPAAVHQVAAQSFDVVAPFATLQTASASGSAAPGSPGTAAAQPANATDLLYATYLGGLGEDAGYAVAVDAAGSAFVTGVTLSTGFPAAPGAFQVTCGLDPSAGCLDAFVAKLSPGGASLSYATFIGGNNLDLAYGIAVDSSGQAYVTGATYSSNFPTTPAAVRPAYSGGAFDGFVVKLNPTGTSLVYATYLGGARDDYGYGLAVDASGAAYVTGKTFSLNFPTTPGALQPAYGAGIFDAFVSKLNAAGSALTYSTYLGGNGNDVGSGIAIDASGAAYIAGYTFSTDFPTRPGAFQSGFGGGEFDGFVAKLNPTGGALVYSTYLGASGLDAGYGIVVDTGGNAIVTGITAPPVAPVPPEARAFPTTPGAFQTTYGGGPADSFVAKLNPSGAALVYSTFLGGNGFDAVGGSAGSGIALDSLGNAYLTGSTNSTNFPTRPDAAQPAYGGAGDAFLAKLNPGGAALLSSTYLGGSGVDEGDGVAVDSTGRAYLVGVTSGTFPITAGAFQAAYGGGPADAFVAHIAAGGAAPPPTSTAGSGQPVPTRTPGSLAATPSLSPTGSPTPIVSTPVSTVPSATPTLAPTSTLPSATPTPASTASMG